MQKLLLAVVLGAALSTGCSILEEIDNIGADAETSKQTGDGCEEGSAAEGCGESEKSRPNSWANAQTVNPAEMKGDIVPCRVGGRNRFMNRSACLATGGKPAR